MAYKCNYVLTAGTGTDVGTSPITLFELQTTARPIEILRVWISQSNGISSSQTGVQMLYKTVSITGTTFNPIAFGETGWPATTIQGKVNASGEGTDDTSNIFYKDNFNVLNGWLYLPLIDERLYVAPNKYFALKLIAPVTNLTYSYGVIFREH